MVNTEASITLNDLVIGYIKEFGLSPNVREKDEPVKKTPSEKRGEMLVHASFIEEPDYTSVIRAVRRTVSVLEDFENEVVTGDLSEQREWRRKIEQIASIMHVSRTYPENAIKRLKRLRPVTEKVV